jgi:hypothetical protein
MTFPGDRHPGRDDQVKQLHPVVILAAQPLHRGVDEPGGEWHTRQEPVIGVQGHGGTYARARHRRQRPHDPVPLLAERGRETDLRVPHPGRGQVAGQDAGRLAAQPGRGGRVVDHQQLPVRDRHRAGHMRWPPGPGQPPAVRPLAVRGPPPRPVGPGDLARDHLLPRGQDHPGCGDVGHRGAHPGGHPAGRVIRPDQEDDRCAQVLFQARRDGHSHDIRPCPAMPAGGMPEVRPGNRAVGGGPCGGITIPNPWRHVGMSPRSRWPLLARGYAGNHKRTTKSR